MNISISAPINHTGYGIASSNIVRELAKYNNISYFPIGQPSVDSKEDYDLFTSLIHNSEDFEIDAPYVKIWHQFDLAERIGRGKYFAYPFFELDTLNKREAKHLSVPDELFVSSDWAKHVILDHGINSNINVVPLGVNSDIFNASLVRQRTNDKYVFLTIGKWEVRKGHDLLPSLFKKAFPNEKDVELWILAAEHTNSYSSKDEINKWKELYKSSNIKVFGGVESHKDVAQLICDSDCGLYISRAEGWNLELLETMSMNRPAIATYYSAHTEFCTKDNSYLVDIDETEKAFDGKVFRGQGNWAKIGQKQIDQTIEYMRYLYKNRINTNPEGLNTAKKLSWKNSADIIYGCIT
jgi:glycosyltransferase involved in cell wall biosynthesis